MPVNQQAITLQQLKPEAGEIQEGFFAF